MKEEFNKRRLYMFDRVSKMQHVSTLKPQGAFYVFINISELLDMEYKGEKVGDVSRLAKILIEDYATAVIPCADFGFADHIRLSYAISIESITKGLDRIEKFIGDLK
jgi:aspartate aminotransferase